MTTKPKCIDNINQSAFISGRNIQDNILVAQELLRGYNRKGGPKRCSLKIDIAKAYDTVSWVFLETILTKFGFHKKMVSWIITCVTSSAFSVCVNGGIHGYFKAGRGLRQGDPISPYLFTLVMEVFTLLMAKNVESASEFKYHAGCAELKLTHLCFADDLLVLCYGSVNSVKVIKKSLEEFSKVSGLASNMSKVLCFLGILILENREEYLRLKSQGGLGLKNLSDWNEALLVKHIWNIINKKESLWVKWVYAVKLKGGRSFWDIDNEYSDSSLWKSLLDLRDKIRPHIRHKIGNGNNTSIWYDWWHESGPLCNIISRRKIHEAGFVTTMNVADMVTTNGRWNWPDDWVNQYPILAEISRPTDSDTRDKVVWKKNNGKDVEFSVSIVWEDLKENTGDVHWSKLVWYSQGIPSNMFILWLAVQERLLTQDRIMVWNKDANMRCYFCKEYVESHQHLFFQCKYSNNVWKEMLKKNSIQGMPCNWRDIIAFMSSNCSNNTIANVVGKLVLGAKVYYIWQERNRRYVCGEERSEKVLIENISEVIKLRLMGLKVKDTAKVKEVYKKWGIQPNIVVKIE
uniref:uncharacterized protein LOC122596855 n=1 Tax=Erigeron canadensis TaxID=72917 RepID=UPI001CB8F7D7|nr:uncharacterized protein LOC122596855 [Erigeron canadensis]